MALSDKQQDELYAQARANGSSLTAISRAVVDLQGALDRVSAKLPKTITVNPAPVTVTPPAPVAAPVVADPTWSALLSELLRRVLGKS